MQVVRGATLGGRVGVAGRDRAAGSLVLKGKPGQAVVPVVENAVAVVAP